MTSLVFTGDIGFDRYMEGKWEDPDLIAPEVLDFLHSANHVIANVEGPLVDADTNKTTQGTVQLMHTMNPAATAVLRNMKADIWNLCNNHIMDAGEDGLKATLKKAHDFGASVLGAGMNDREASTPLYLSEAGGIGIFSVGYERGCKPAGPEKGGVLSWSNLSRIRELITEIKSRCRWCIIVAHAGEEFTSLPSPYTRDRYLEYLSMGADIIVAHHPHVPMNYERVDDKIIFYSLGNFIFDTPYQRSQFNTERGILVRLNLTEDAVTFDAMGLEIERGPEHIIPAPLPRIFCDVPAHEYELLSPLATKMFLAATRRQQIYLNPDEFAHADEAKWAEHFANPKRSGRVPGEVLDFLILCPLAERESEKSWEKSTLEDVKSYILEQM